MMTAAALLPGAQGNHHARPRPSGVLLNDVVYSARYDIVPKTRSMDLIYSIYHCFCLISTASQRTNRMG
jgi:hypothetical protein